MFQPIKRILTAATVMLAVSAPSAAYARFVQDPPVPPAVSGQVQSAIVAFGQHATASSPEGFQWDDAGIGAAGMLVLAGVGSGAVVARRRRVHNPLAN
jgi:hypothetical protein